LESHSLETGDEIIIIGPTTGVVQMVVNEIRLDDKKTNQVQKGDVFSVAVGTKIRPSDKLYKLVDAT